MASNMRPAEGSSSTRLWQLLLGLVAMMAVSSPQYVWTLFVRPMQADLRVGLAALQSTIAIFSFCQCALGPLHGYIATRVSPRVSVSAGGLLIALGWMSSAYANSLPMMYVTYGLLSGLGSGLAFVAVTSSMNEWFPHRRGLAVGVVAGGYGFGAIATTFPIDAAIKAEGFRHALLVYGAILGSICVAAALGMKRPSQHASVAGNVERADDRRQVPSREMLRAPAFWLLFLMMTMVGTGGLMTISQMAVFAVEFGIRPTTTVLGMAALPLALTIDRFANGAARPLFGWVSDHIGRENTMCIAFVMEAAAVMSMLILGSNPVAFVLLSALIFLGFGEIFSLFPSAQADIFGTKHAAQNFGFLFASIAISSILGGPLAALLYERTGSWRTVFLLVAAMDMTAAILAIFVLKPMRMKVGRCAETH
jgi:OFA family oxalate/formate antiporter-like MFS transporter